MGTTLKGRSSLSRGKTGQTIHQAARTFIHPLRLAPAGHRTVLRPLTERKAFAGARPALSVREPTSSSADPTELRNPRPAASASRLSSCNFQRAP